jgi:hypothetical protein
LLAEAGASPNPAATPTPTAAPVTTTTQAEIVLWKSIENSINPDDYNAYLQQYPNGAFAALAKVHLESAMRSQKEKIAESESIRMAGVSFPAAAMKGTSVRSNGVINVHPGGMTYTASSQDANKDTPFQATCAEIAALTIETRFEYLVIHTTDGQDHRFKHRSYKLPDDSPSMTSLYDASRTEGAQRIINEIRRDCP